MACACKWLNRSVLQIIFDEKYIIKYTFLQELNAKEKIVCPMTDWMHSWGLLENLLLEPCNLHISVL